MSRQDESLEYDTTHAWRLVVVNYAASTFQYISLYKYKHLAQNTYYRYLQALLAVFNSAFRLRSCFENSD